MSDQKTQYQQLSERFPTEVHKTVNKGGGDQTYVPASDVIERLNTVLTCGGWSFGVLREGFTETEAWVLGRITATVDGQVLQREQYGNESIMMGQRPTMDLLKKAATDSLKKCASLMGVAAYLYDADERREVQAEMRQAAKPASKRTAAQEPVTPPSCADCNAEVRGGQYPDGRPFTADALVGWGQKHYGRALCATCYKAARKAAERAEAVVA